MIPNTNSLYPGMRFLRICRKENKSHKLNMLIFNLKFREKHPQEMLPYNDCLPEETKYLWLLIFFSYKDIIFTLAFSHWWKSQELTNASCAVLNKAKSPNITQMMQHKERKLNKCWTFPCPSLVIASNMITSACIKVL